MTHSGPGDGLVCRQLNGPILDKHSSGGVGDKISLMLAPIVAACGGVVPMISGRGLGHTGGTLDKLGCIPGYQATPDVNTLHQALKTAGCAIIGQTDDLAPADRRLYAIRDVTATVESVPLITASILSKKLAAGLQGLVMDVKVGNGAFAASMDMATRLAQSLVQVAGGAGLPTRAWLTDMNQVLGHTCGNALEVLEAIDFLKGKNTEPRQLALTRTLCAELLVMGGWPRDDAEALQKVDHALQSGQALEHFSRMIFALGGPADLVDQAHHYLAAAPVQRALASPRCGWVSGMATRDIGLLIVELGGGRRRPATHIDPRVGLHSGRPDRPAGVQAGEPLAVVHAADAAAAEQAAARLLTLLQIGEAPVSPPPVMLQRIGADGQTSFA
jgi:thymidine phosphorylase